MIDEKVVLRKIKNETERMKGEIEDTSGLLADAGKALYAMGLLRAAEIIKECAGGQKDE